MFILSINSGSQTLKYKLYEAESFKLLKKGKIADIGFGGVKNHFEAIKKAVKELKNYETEIKIIGHRYVNGGSEFVNPLIVDKEVIEKLKKYNELAPLHNPHNLEGIKATLKIVPQALSVAIFDTYFYKDLPKVAKNYALNKEVAKKYGYCRMGFHGTSHRYAVYKTAKSLGKDMKKIKVISLHLGGGASITATKNGKAIDTSMGFTPMEGLVMMTRAGDIDSGIIIDLMRQGMKDDKIDELLNEKSGIYGLCKKKGMLEVLDDLDNPETRDAFDIYIYRIKKYIGAYFAILRGCDAIVFTGTIGAGKPETREEVMKSLSFLKGIPVLTVSTNEEIMIAKDAWEAVKEMEDRIN